MEKSIVIAGFGGQGVLFAGMILAYAGMESGKNVTWIPSYGPEMRGGTANATVTISDDEVGSPVVLRPHAVVALNTPSVHKYEPNIREQGVLIYNSSLVSDPHHRADIAYVPIPAGETATRLGEVRMANMVCLGALVEVTGVLTLSALDKALRDHMPKRRHKMVEPNLQALREGARLAKEPTKTGGQVSVLSS